MRRVVSIRIAHPRLRVPRAAVARAMRLLDGHADDFRAGCPAGELSLVFMTDSGLARLHAEFMDDPTPTDVITFAGEPPVPGVGPAAGETGTAGEICVSVDAAARHVRRSGSMALPPAPVRASAFADELTLYLVHGWLHLAGYDDRKPVAKRRMRAAEKRAMTLLRRAGAVPAFRLA